MHRRFQTQFDGAQAGSHVADTGLGGRMIGAGLTERLGQPLVLLWREFRLVSQSLPKFQGIESGGAHVLMGKTPPSDIEALRTMRGRDLQIALAAMRDAEIAPTATLARRPFACDVAAPTEGAPP